MAPARIVLTLALLCGLAHGMYRPARQQGLSVADIKKGCSSNPADIVFVLDESGSIWGPDFDRQLQFVEDVVEIFNIGPKQTQIGVLTFSDIARPHFQLDTYKNAQGINNHIETRIVQQRGGTNTATAISAMDNDFFSEAHSRKGVSHIAIVITDGESENTALTAEAALRAKSHPNMPITVFAVGVGRSINRAELNSIASSPSSEYVYTVTDYSALDALKTKLAWKACQVTTQPPPTTTTPEPTTTLPQFFEGCDGHHPADIVFTLPDQAGITDTETSISFIKSILETATMGPDAVRAGLAPKNCYNVEEIRLKDNKKLKGFTNDLDERLLRTARISDTLDYLIDVAYSPANGGRQGAVKFAIMLIDNSPESRAQAEDKAEALKMEGVRVIAVGIKPHVTKNELRGIAYSNDDIIMVDSYDELASVKDDVDARICNGIRSGP